MNKKIATKDILGPMRLPFLILPPMCVAVGIGTAYWQTGSVNGFYALLALLGAILSHVSVNAFNEYYDFKSGLDSKTQKTPFSGGSGTLQENPKAAKATLLTAWISFSLTLLIGIYFLAVRGMLILPLGILGLLLVYLYTTWITHYWVLTLIAPGLGFGTLWVMGTHFVLTGEYTATAFAASLIPFFLVNNLLLLNQFPDATADVTVGRRNLPIKIGNQASSRVYVLFLLLTYLSIIGGVVFHYLPTWALLGLVTLPLAFIAGKSAMKHANDIPKLMPALGQNVLINLLTPLLLAIGLWLARAF